MSIEDQNYAQTIAELARQAEPRIICGDMSQTPQVVLHQEMKLVDVEQFMARPGRIRESFTVLEPVSFIEYFNRFGVPSSIVRVSDRKRTMHAILDYHDIGSPSHCNHRITLEPAMTLHFGQWKERSGHYMDQRSFAEFLEDHLGDIVKPDAADILDMVRTIRIIRGGSYLSEIDATASGVKVDISSEVRAKCGSGGLEIPSHITLRTQVFRFGNPIEIKARVRVRPDDGNLKICYELIDIDAVIEREFRELANKAIDGIGNVIVLDV